MERAVYLPNISEHNPSDPILLLPEFRPSFVTWTLVNLPWSCSWFRIDLSVCKLDCIPASDLIPSMGLLCLKHWIQTSWSSGPHSSLQLLHRAWARATLTMSSRALCWLSLCALQTQWSQCWDCPVLHHPFHRVFLRYGTHQRFSSLGSFSWASQAVFPVSLSLPT